MDLAYAAGFFDGEGSINISMQTRKNGMAYHALAVDVSQKVKAPLEWLRERFGGSIKSLNHKWNDKVYWRWQIVSAEAGDFLKQIQPYCIVKSEEIVVALKFRETMQDFKARSTRGQFPPLTSDLIEARNAFVVQLVKIREEKYEKTRRRHRV